MAEHLTRKFAQQTEQYGSIEVADAESWELIVFLLRSSFEVAKDHPERKHPLEPVKGEIGRWVSNFNRSEPRESGKAVFHLFKTFGLLNICPPKILLEPILKEIERVMPRMEIRDARSILTSLGYLAIDPPKSLLESMDKKLREEAHLLDQKESVFLLQGLAIMDAVLEQYHGRERYNLNALYQHLTDDFDFIVKTETNLMKAHQNMMADAQIWFSGKTHFQYKRKQFDASNSESKIANKLEDCGAEIFKEVDIPGLNHPIDLSALYKNASFHIECDGPSHMVYLCEGTDFYMNGNTIFQSGLIKRAADSPLVRLPNNIFYTYKNDDAFWKGFMDQMSDAQPRSSHMLLAEGGKPKLVQIGMARG